MSPIFTYNGKILSVAGKLAANKACCCGEECAVTCPFNDILDCEITVVRKFPGFDQVEIGPDPITGAPALVRDYFGVEPSPPNQTIGGECGNLDAYFEDIPVEQGGDNGVYLTFDVNAQCEPCLKVVIEYSIDCDNENFTGPPLDWQCVPFEVTLDGCAVPLCEGGPLYTWPEYSEEPDQNGDFFPIGVRPPGPFNLLP